MNSVIYYMTNIMSITEYCHIIDDKLSGPPILWVMKGVLRHVELGGLVVDLMDVAWENLRAAKRLKAPDRRPARFAALRPGPATPVWNELVRHAEPYLRKRGDKVKLARLLGISRQRLHQLLVGRTACADAERTLLLVAWVHARRLGREWV